MHDFNTPTLKLACQFIECSSITPTDAGCQKILASRLEKIGFSTYHLPFGNVQNLWAIRNIGPGPLFVFAGHTDVVPPGNLNDWLTPPFTASIRDGYLYGRGAADMKGGIAAMVTACERLIAKNPEFNGNIAFLITSDEEGPAEEGTKKVIEYLTHQGIQIDYCLVGEPSSQYKVGDTLKNGRRGSLNCALKIIGKQGHVAYPEHANNPIHQALVPMAALSQYAWDAGNNDFPPTTFQISNIKAGTGASNVIPGMLECQFNFRFSNETTPDALLAKVHEILQSHALEYELDYTVSGQPFLTHSKALISACIQAIQELAFLTPTLSTSGGTSDGRFIAPTGAQVIELGLCNATIHCANECVKIEDLELLSHIYERLIEILYGVSCDKPEQE